MRDAGLRFSLSSFGAYDVCVMHGEVTVGELPNFSPHLLKHVQANAGKHLVLDLGDVPHMDSSAIRLVVNLKKRLGETGKTLFLLKPSDQVSSILKNVHLDKVITVVDSCLAVDTAIFEEALAAYRECAYEENGLLRLHCTCAVCGSDKVISYLINPDLFEWRWVEDDPFPTSTMKGSETAADYFALLPTMCLDCCMCATDTSLFHVLKDGKIKMHSTLDDQAKLILSKAIKRRKKMLEETGVVGTDQIYAHPRSRAVLAHIYRLAEECARAVAVTKKAEGAFAVGYLSYLAIRYVENDLKAELINNCRTWLTQAISEGASLPRPVLSKAYFILMNVSLNIDKIKEAANAHQEFSKMIKDLPGGNSAASIENPHFWFQQAENIWHRAIAERSKEISAA